MELTVENVRKTILNCLFNDGEDRTSHIIADGVKLRFGFDTKRIDLQKENISLMLQQLPDNFKQSIGGGWSFVNACNNNKDEQWADSHSTIDELLCLGIAAQLVEFNAPRKMWRSLPGGYPYFFVKF